MNLWGRLSTEGLQGAGGLPGCVAHLPAEPPSTSGSHGHLKIRTQFLDPAWPLAHTTAWVSPSVLLPGHLGKSAEAIGGPPEFPFHS